MIIGDNLERNRRFFPNRMAVTDGKRRVNHEQFANRVFQAMNALLDIGLRKGDRVACLMSNIPEIMELYFAVPASGMTLVPLNYRLSSEELLYQLQDSGARAVIIEGPFTEKLREGSKKQGETPVHILVGDRPEKALHYEDWLKGHECEPPRGLEVHDDDVAVITYTSGTTGKAKGVMLTHRNILSEVYASVGYSGKWAGDGTDVIWASYPLFHVGCIGNLAGIMMGMQNLIANFDAKTVYAFLEKEKVTVWRTAPIMLEMTFASGVDPGQYDLSNLSLISSAGQATTLSTLKKTFEVFPNPELCYTAGLGMTESFTLINYSHITRKNLSKVEELIATLPFATDHIPAGMCGPLPHVDLKIVDDQGREAPAGTIGEIIARGDNIMKGYWNNPQATAEALENGWLHTGDLGMRHPDAPACHFVVGRKKDMIVSGAENVYPAEVELAILKHPSVQAVVVFGVPEKKWGEAVKAAVVLKAGMKATEQEIREFCRSQIASYKKPSSVYFVEDFPRNPFGKVVKNELSRMATRGILGSRCS